MSSTVGESSLENPSELETEAAEMPHAAFGKIYRNRDLRSLAERYAQYYAHPVHRSIALHYYMRGRKPM